MAVMAAKGLPAASLAAEAALVTEEEEEEVQVIQPLQVLTQLPVAAAADLIMLILRI